MRKQQGLALTSGLYSFQKKHNSMQSVTPLHVPQSYWNNINSNPTNPNNPNSSLIQEGSGQEDSELAIHKQENTVLATI
jgi:hypothetical protein